jgi:hypothetical protein
MRTAREQIDWFTSTLAELDERATPGQVSVTTAVGPHGELTVTPNWPGALDARDDVPVMKSSLPAQALLQLQFEAAPKSEQRKILWALGVWLEVKPWVSGGQKHQTVEQRLRLHLGILDDYGMLLPPTQPRQVNHEANAADAVTPLVSMGALPYRTTDKMQARKRYLSGPGRSRQSR